MAEGILFITANRIGDAVLSSGVLAHLMARFPDEAVTLACGPVVAPLFADLPRLERLHPLIRRGRAGHWWDLWRSTVGRRWRVVADLRGSALAFLLASEHRLIAKAGRRREHRIEELARMLGVTEPPLPVVWLSPERRARAEARLAGLGPILAVGPTANWGAKQWPAPFFAEAITRLTALQGPLPGAHVAVFGAGNERAMAQPVLDAVPAERLADFVGQSDLLDAAALLGRCALYLGNDSGLMHLAAATGTPTLGLFGPSPEWRYHPWGPHSAVVRTPESYEDLVGAPDFDHRLQDSLMTGLTVETVVAAAEDLWQRRH